MRTEHRNPRGSSDGGALLFVLGLVLGLLCALVAERLTSTLADRDIELIRAVRNLALEEFAGDVDSEELVDNALRGMMAGLDEHSRFYGPEEVEQISRETSGEFRGIGVVFEDPSIGRVLFAFPGSPADRAGLRTGDRFVEVGGVAVDEMEPGGLRASLRAQDDESIRAVVEDLDGEPREVVLKPEQVLDPTVRHARLVDEEHHIGYLSILSFSHRTPGEFDRALQDLREQGVERLVIDLRHNPGGILEAAVQIANRFIAEGTIVATRSRSETEVAQADPSEARFRGVPLVVLVDGGSASASEVLAGALQDHSVAALIGTSTYGKGTVQTLRPFSDDRGIIKMTTGRYYTPSWRAIERSGDSAEASGISPDHVVSIDDDERNRVYGYLNSYSPPRSVLEPIMAWEEREERELYARPPRDRQLDAAVALLSGTAPPSDVVW